MRSIDERLKDIELKEEQMRKIRKDAALKGALEGGSALASLVTGGISDIFRPILDINMDIEQGIRDTKQTHLLEIYLNKMDDMSHAFEELKHMIGDIYGNHLFNRLLWILDQFPPEDIYISLISNVLGEFIKRGNYKKLFGTYQLHLRMIERLSPQALYLLSNYKELSPFTKSGYTLQRNLDTGKMELQNDWSRDVVISSSLDELICPVVSELIDDHYLVAIFSDDDQVFIPTLTASGKILLDYLV